MTVGWGAAAAYTHAEKLLTKGKVEAVALGTGATTTLDLLCGGDNELTLLADMTGAADADLAVTVVPFEADGVTLLANAPLPAVRSTGPKFTGAAVQYTGTFDVSGIDKVRITVKNNNAGAQTLTRLSWRLS